MIITLIGYMGSGKTHISKILSSKMNYQLIDLDFEITLLEKDSIAGIFQKKGEIYFRKIEKKILNEILTSQEDAILSVGGGTPVFYDNMKTINRHSTSVYLRTSVPVLSERLSKQKEKRPLIAHLSNDALPEFIAKHLFERNVFYGQARHIINTDLLTPDEICDEICQSVKNDF